MENENMNQEANRFDNQTVERPEPATIPPQVPYEYMPSADPAQQNESDNPKKHLGLAIASLILSGVSVLCCWFYGLSVIPALIGTIFGLICVIKGKKSVRIMGAVGLGLGIFGLIMGIVMIVTYAAMINWDAFNLETFRSIENIDPNNQEEVYQWMQQFFNIDIMKYSHTGYMN